MPLSSSIPPKSDFAESEEAEKLKQTQSKTRSFLDSILAMLSGKDDDQ